MPRMHTGVAARIDRIETFIVDIPTLATHHLSPRSQMPGLVRVSCSDGRGGVGEGTAIGGLRYGADSPEGITLTIDTAIGIGRTGSIPGSARDGWFLPMGGAPGYYRGIAVPLAIAAQPEGALSAAH
ncbi:hypothetical protein [Xanthobacter autotrophicus]|uniref:hypothetical protein n=1 Tax=Xanthobacter autotrophicus TaxID=280 RepID=UPI0024A65186|nr:hypothetical protein [Xanthobacter autotrophicus]MDI4655633.1 hypothetical protein [Xanthobacter autotrophicus]